MTVRAERCDAVRAKLADLDLRQADVDHAVAWARSTAMPAAACRDSSAEQAGDKSKRRKKTAARKSPPHA